MSQLNLQKQLITLYWQVANQRIYEIMREDWADLDEFRYQVANWSTQV